MQVARALPLLFAGALASINRKRSTVTPDSSELMGYRVCCWGVFALSPSLVPPPLLETPTLYMGQFDKGSDSMKCGEGGCFAGGGVVSSWTRGKLQQDISRFLFVCLFTLILWGLSLGEGK